MASHLQILQPFHVWYWWNLHANLIDFDHLMDHFACDGSHDERTFRSCEDFDKWSEQETNCSDIWTYCFEKKNSHLITSQSDWEKL